MVDIRALERKLWDTADQLRANSKLTATEYCMPVLGLIFLRHAYNRFSMVEAELMANRPMRGGKALPVTSEDFKQKSALYLPEEARFNYLVTLSEDEDIGKALNQAMESIEAESEQLKGVLPKTYTNFENGLLKELLRNFNNEILASVGGDVIGRIYEYFLSKFAQSGAQEGGEFFTPVSLVQMIVNIIEPDHGTILDPACGSGGMFVQTGHFMEQHGLNANTRVTFYGQEKTENNAKLARMNLAVHGLSGNIKEGNTFQTDEHNLEGRCDFVMANPPFNVDKVKAKTASDAGRLPFGLPGVNKANEVSNANYLWIQYFYAYLNEHGRAGFVMAGSATDAGNKDKDIRRQLVESGHVDVILSVANNFFYTKSLPSTLWFFDKGKPEELKDKVLMIDARNVYHKVDRTLNEWTPEQMKNLTAIVWLYRGQKEHYIKLLEEYTVNIVSEYEKLEVKGSKVEDLIQSIYSAITALSNDNKVKKTDQHSEFINAISNIDKSMKQYEDRKVECLEVIRECDKKHAEKSEQYDRLSVMLIPSEALHDLQKSIEHAAKVLKSALDFTDKEIKAKEYDCWDSRQVYRWKKELDEEKEQYFGYLKNIQYLQRHAKWIIEKFKSGEFKNIEGLCKLVDKEEIESNDWSLTPGRFVGVAQEQAESEDDFTARIQEIHIELVGLHKEAAKFMDGIQTNFKELGL